MHSTKDTRQFAFVNTRDILLRLQFREDLKITPEGHRQNEHPG